MPCTGVVMVMPGEMVPVALRINRRLHRLLVEPRWTLLFVLRERLGITEQFQGVDALTIGADGTFEVLERIEGGRHQVSTCVGPPAVFGWATGHLREPANNPQLGMANMRTLMPALQKAKPATVAMAGTFASAAVPSQRRDTRVVKDLSPDVIAQEIVEWIQQ